MSSSVSLDEKFEGIMKNYQFLSAQNEILIKKIHEDAQCGQDLKAQNKYLKNLLGAFLKQNQKMYAEPTRSEYREEEQEASNPLSSSSDDELVRRARMEPIFQANSNDFRDEILEFVGKLDPDEFLEWIHTVEDLLVQRTTLRQEG